MTTSTSIPLLSLIGDAISLGPHWVYDANEIAAKIERPDLYHDPITSYHPGKKAGDFTHYGDQSLLLLKHLAATGEFDLTAYAKAWRGYWENPSTISYRDGATKATLANLEAGLAPEKAGSPSSDIAGAGRIAPLFMLQWEDDEALVKAARSLVAFTHHDAAVIDAAEFFTRLALAVQGGKSIPEAIAELFGSSTPLFPASVWEAAQSSATSGKPDSDVLDDFGLSCNISGGFPGVLHLLLKYPVDPAAALIANAKAGGDNAARGTILGLIYGAAGVGEKIPDSWLNELKAKDEIEATFKGFADS